MAYTAAETRANAMFTALGITFTLPAVDLTQAQFQLPSAVGNPLHDAIDEIELSDLTTGTIGGTGSFETLMASMRSHLDEEYRQGRITGDQFTKAYIELTALAMGTGLQFVMGKELANWQMAVVKEQAKRAQIESVGAAVNLETAKAQLAMARYQAETAEAQFALTKMQLATEDAKFELTWTQVRLTEAQILVQAKQLEIMDGQIALVDQQTEIAHAQWSDVIMGGGGTTYNGLIKRQKDLLEQQKEAFIRDADARVAKMFVDTWTVRRTTDETIGPPDALTDPEITEVMNLMRSRASMGTM